MSMSVSGLLSVCLITLTNNYFCCVNIWICFWCQPVFSTSDTTAAFRHPTHPDCIFSTKWDTILQGYSCCDCWLDPPPPSTSQNMDFKLWLNASQIAEWLLCTYYFNGILSLMELHLAIS